MYAVKAEFEILFRDEAPECLFGWSASACGVFKWMILSPVAMAC